ncbi:hypothetical protein FMEAI12_5540033 [Parafrankia sp. Ea1.12]|nr:hypothetical protein FMEAI12_5540033 [Parafrankia sp. Ea1.12]
MRVKGRRAPEPTHRIHLTINPNPPKLGSLNLLPIHGEARHPPPTRRSPREHIRQATHGPTTGRNPRPLPSHPTTGPGASKNDLSDPHGSGVIDPAGPPPTARPRGTP